MATTNLWTCNVGNHYSEHLLDRSLSFGNRTARESSERKTAANGSTQRIEMKVKKIKVSATEYALVSDVDFKRVKQFTWHAHRTKTNTYASRNVKRGEQCLLHRFIVGVTDPKVQVDHYPDKAGLNCQRGNLRTVNNEQNAEGSRLSKRNTSGYKGVSWRANRKSWVAQICIKGRQTGLGYFKTSRKAALAYDVAALRHYGKWALTNDMLGLL